MLNSTVSVGTVLIRFTGSILTLQLKKLKFFVTCNPEKIRIGERDASLNLCSHSVPRASDSDIFLFVEISVLL